MNTQACGRDGMKVVGLSGPGVRHMHNISSP